MYTRFDYFPYQLLHCFVYLQTLQITKLQKLTLISSLILNHLSDCAFLPCITRGDHAVKKIKTQASRGEYDVDAALELRVCTFMLMA